jgi:hypothetical protein
MGIIAGKEPNWLSAQKSTSKRFKVISAQIGMVQNARFLPLTYFCRDIKQQLPRPLSE